jgi:hypothetical protein
MKELIDEMGRIRYLFNYKLNESKEANDWNTIYTWAKLFSTDNGNFLIKNNITSGVWLKDAFESGKITLQDIDNVTRESDGVKFSELPMVKNLIWNTIYTWAKLFSTDNGNFLIKNNITSGVWLKDAFESGKITLQDIDNVTRESDGVKFSELPMVKNLIK